MPLIKTLQTTTETASTQKTNSHPKTILNETSVVGKEHYSHNKITEITLMQKTIIHIYPDGSKHIQKHLCSQWIQGMQDIYKKNAKEKATEKAKVMEIGKMEEAVIREL